MKVILNKDLATLGEEGDVKDVARGYARNYLFPRRIALPYTESTIKLIESRKEEIEARKETKRKDALGLKEKLESLEITITMPAGANGKLYGAVTSQTVADELAKQGFQIERKRIELAGTNFKSVGKYKAAIKLYESAAAEITITVAGQEIKTEAHHAPARGKTRSEERRKAASREAEGQNANAAPAEGQTPAVDTAAAESPRAEETAPQAGGTDAAEASDPAEPAGGAADGAEAPETVQE
ncbi:MAG: 50S ribosomal protein L9 [Treponema sp.]|jgi:large subunit ribosomal protein L9|nr:50S ribosomal protein L9 [Treponema sp.]